MTQSQCLVRYQLAMSPNLPIPAELACGQPSTPTAAPPGYVDLIAGSLREVCDQDDTVLALIARVIDQHLAGCLQEHRIGRWRNEALDHLLARISPAMQARVRQR